MSRLHLQAVQTNAQMRASANNLLDAHDISTPPVNIYQILHDKDIPVDFLPFSSKVEGIYLKNVTGVGIAINSNHHPVKKRFTGSHELKHHLHDVPEHGEMLCSSDFQKWRIEQRANRFAAELLAPPHFIQEVIEELVRTELLTITTLAKVFHVSYPTIVYRLHTLGYISDGQRDRLLKQNARQDDKHAAMLLNGNVNAARLRMPTLIATLGSANGFSYCSQCSELVYDPAWSICYSCGDHLQ